MSAYTAPSVHNVTHILYNEQGGKCYYCKQDMLTFNDSNLSVNESSKRASLPLYPTYEHAKVLRMHGGKKTKENGVCSCRQCNNLKGIINHDAFTQIVTCMDDQYRLISHPPIPSVIPTVRRFVVMLLRYIVHRTDLMKRSLPKKKKKVVQQTQPKDNNAVYNYQVNNIAKIKIGMLSQDGKCCMCKSDMIMPHTVNKKYYMASDLRPILVKKTTAVVCFGCGSSIKQTVILAKLNVVF